jgi:hypothetical protein
MNERIKELISQAQKEVWGNSPYNGSPEFEGYELDAEKFAKLIVRECIETLRLVPYDTDQEFGDEVIYQNAVRKHFGVEE